MPIKEGRQASCVFLQLGTDFVCVCVLLSEIERLRNLEKVQAGEQRKGTSGGIGGVDVKQYELMIAALHL